MTDKSKIVKSLLKDLSGIVNLNTDSDFSSKKYFPEKIQVFRGVDAVGIAVIIENHCDLKVDINMNDVDNFEISICSYIFDNKFKTSIMYSGHVKFQSMRIQMFDAIDIFEIDYKHTTDGVRIVGSDVLITDLTVGELENVIKNILRSNR